jgi:hypothetical protein
MSSNFALTPMELVFLITAAAVTIPLGFFVWWVLKELKKEKTRNDTH